VIRILVFTHRFQWDVVVLAARRTCRLFLRQDERVAAKKFV